MWCCGVLSEGSVEEGVGEVRWTVQGDNVLVQGNMKASDATICSYLDRL